jgi:hypothetical protein
MNDNEFSSETGTTMSRSINPWCLLQFGAGLNHRQARTWRNW